MQLVPVTIRDANRFVQAHHRHAGPVPGAKFALAAASDGGELVGVALVGRPVARALDDDRTLEVRQLCTTGAPNACSLLLGAAWRAAKALGYRRLVTYTLATESGASLRAAGFPGNRPGGGAELELPVAAPHRQASPGRAGPLGDLPVTRPFGILSLGAAVQSSTCSSGSTPPTPARQRQAPDRHPASEHDAATPSHRDRTRPRSSGRRGQG